MAHTNKYMLYILIVIGLLLPQTYAFPDQGKWDRLFNTNLRSLVITKSLFAGSEIYVQITCDSSEHDKNVVISWELHETNCWLDPCVTQGVGLLKMNETSGLRSPKYVRLCSNGGVIILPQIKVPPTRPNINDKNAEAVDYANGDGTGNRVQRDTGLVADEHKPVVLNNRPNNNPAPIFTTQNDAVYIFALHIEPEANIKDYNASVHIEMRGVDGYLSAADWPFLPFYGIMCFIYVLYGVVWLTVSFMQWRDLLRIQFWISGVILLGMLEKAMFYAEFQSINTTGTSVPGAVLMADWVSCGKRTLARMLVIIVSLGFGIVKPRLGPMLHRVVGTGALYFVLASVESYMRATNRKSDPKSQVLVAGIPLAVLDSAICWWIFTSLVQTTRTLRLRRNTVKLQLYRHFTNTLIFAVIASVIFMLYSIKTHRYVQCLTDWKDLWQDDGFWHILFSFLLLVIMILWRPTNNNQRYAFTPLLDNPEDEDDDDEEDQFISDVYGVKMRGSRNLNSPKLDNMHKTTNEEDDLRWVEENIPTSIVDATLPVLDSDEEIINTRFEVSKMQ